MKFMGEYNHTIDTKGRVIVPAKFRELLGEEFVVAKGNDGCLSIYTNEAWDAFLEKITQLPANRGTREYIRVVVSSAVNVEVDKQGRILIPAGLREHAGLEKEVVLAGAISKVEVWDKARWDEVTGNADIDSIAEEMAELGLSI